MATGKLYIGRRVRDLRQANRATQAQFAERLGISVSYLNQIENNQRPVSAGVLLALAEKFRIDLAELSGGEGDRLVSALSETLSDSLFDGYAPSLQELKLITQNAPGFAHALITAPGSPAEMAPWLADHSDVNAVDLAGAGDLDWVDLQLRAAETLKRVLEPGEILASPQRIAAFTEVKTVWHPKSMV